ncbi:hypothetical protein BDV95DRAFT_74356 [Massariosphaeria phaeospora]|uniref:Uncharacterized protein n=1 Tax=Massariosphaeria phaeospora TaxID=100035 RepID=A0A7C8M4J6_9PLEO|nr:hypothetical protein BDV95DRAFT_74356 [Massariosphaeria phaeospora]
MGWDGMGSHRRSKKACASRSLQTQRFSMNLKSSPVFLSRYCILEDPTDSDARGWESRCKLDDAAHIYLYSERLWVIATAAGLGQAMCLGGCESCEGGCSCSCAWTFTIAASSSVEELHEPGRKQAELRGGRIRFRSSLDAWPRKEAERVRS